MDSRKKFGDFVNQSTYKSNVNKTKLKATLNRRDYQEGELVCFEFKLENQTEKEVTLTFSSGQEYDYVLQHEEIGVIEQFSEGKFFIQAFKNLNIGKGEAKIYSISFPSLKKGTYSLMVWSTALEVKVLKQSVKFTI
ncbi:BsuPI-related putative proteinase inhibitor [Litchfieldia alkalitelluris]|uniref:BsuPI-related putative proteinase inhibitor n=1 Tax=Litchfieldia alkalitelluris TaxID=304268 RepID=UPI000998B5D1|nr:BsuPI-related putative proteinase inhibitor [Litchfieldia alkalitelluris]